MHNLPQIEYLIKPDGTIVERVINGDGISCVTKTAMIESELGQVEERELLPEYYEAQVYSEIEQQE
ncbi:MAG: DUF2997 domain-containing protein [Pseudanabaenaceae cyanobacterium]